MTAFSIILSFIGISISFASLIFAIVYLVRIFLLEKKLEPIKQAIIANCVLYNPNPNAKETIIDGNTVINNIKRKCHCDDWEAISIFYQDQISK